MINVSSTRENECVDIYFLNWIFTQQLKCSVHGSISACLLAFVLFWDKYRLHLFPSRSIQFVYDSDTDILKIRIVVFSYNQE